HMTIVDIEGQEAYKFLRYLLANDIDKLKIPGAALYSCMLNEAGGVIDDLICYRKTFQDYRVVVNAATHDKDIAWFKKQIQGFDAKLIEHNDLAMLAIQGPNAREKVKLAFTNEQILATEKLRKFYGVEVGNWWIARTGYTGEDGYEIILPKNEALEFWDKLIAIGIRPCGLIARDSLRLEVGMSLYGSEMDETTSPLISNLSWTVAFEPLNRDFIGRKALEEERDAGIKKKLVGLVLEERGVPRSHQKVIVPTVGEGETTSGGFSPILNAGIALARVPINTKEQCFLVIRDKQLKARVIQPPFVSPGTKNF
ncbi:MAG: glycine cleavage system aminomethyltransferase GcvT, partial [Gammaproteobacteria bacterium]|nr:glycine cleavage system aminomethyltransferase GcvT [Gammaproteobacteria bacterium]